MNFFESQDKAKRNTSWLVLMFVLAILGMVAVFYIVAHWVTIGQPPTLVTLNWQLMMDVSVGLLALVSIGSIFKIITLNSGGGEAVAQSLGGQLVSPATTRPQERQLLNIVGEIALAAGCPVPQVYIIPDNAINAFAAGSKPGNAVIGVTAGALKEFSRDEMQGVIAHEFSHIINGDMRLNLRLIGIIHGIMLLSYLGYFLLRSSFFVTRGTNKEGMAALALPVAGLLLIVIGAIGAFFGSIIRAAVSRQREFLADASAVQFTRNPDGIGGALQKIGVRSGLLATAKAAEVAHMFFAKGAGLSFAGLMATHPPINERIQRILPQWDGAAAISKGLEKSVITAESDLPSSSAANFSGSALADTSSSASESPPDLFAMLLGQKEQATHITAQVGGTNPAAHVVATHMVEKIPPILQSALKDSYSARALVYAMLLDRRDKESYRIQCEHLHNFSDEGVYDVTMRLEPEIMQLPHAACLPLLLRVPPALRLMSQAQYERFVRNTHALIAADAAVDLFEWSVEAVLLHHLAGYFGVPSRKKLPSTQTAMAYALSMMAQAGHPQTAKSIFNTVQQGLNLTFSNDTFLPEKLSLAMQQLNKLSSKQKEHFLQKTADCAAHDGFINPDEGILLRAYAALLDCPLPLVLEKVE